VGRSCTPTPGAACAACGIDSIPEAAPKMIAIVRTSVSIPCSCAVIQRRQLPICSVHKASHGSDDIAMADRLDKDRHLWPRQQHARVGMSGVKEKRHSMV
jgi:hypothetical protein